MSRTSLRFQKKEFQAQVASLLDAINITPKDVSLFYLACVHRSSLNESKNRDTSQSNERLEYLWDAVLELVITEFLYHEFPDKQEWEMTDIRSALVRWKNLAHIAQKLGLYDAIQLSRGEYNAEGHKNPYILANTLEAIIGALYLDSGFEIAKKWIAKNIYSTLPHILRQGLYVDPKSYLQELTQQIWGILPVYTLEKEIGQDHNKTYAIIVTLDDTVIWRWKGTSKKKWEQEAAENAIENRKNWDSQIRAERKDID